MRLFITGDYLITTFLCLKHDDMLWWLLLCVTHLECQYHYHIDVEDNRTEQHYEASSLRAYHAQQTMMESRSFYDLLSQYFSKLSPFICSHLYQQCCLSTSRGEDALLLWICEYTYIAFILLCIYYYNPCESAISLLIYYHYFHR